MPTTTIALHDGVNHDARRIDTLILREFQFGDLIIMTHVDLGTMPGAMDMLARLSGEPRDALATMTMDDAHTALLGLSAHMSKHMPVGAR